MTPPSDFVLNPDRRAMTEILLNGTGNASKFTRRDLLRFEFGARQLNSHTNGETRVFDIGIGIRPNDQNRLYQALVHVGGTRCTPRLKSTGLGLFISREFALLLGGNIQITSEFGVGSTFKLVLLEQKPMGARILIIEDNTANLELMIYLLNSFGHTSLEARDGRAGLEAAHGAEPDLVLCDLQLPLIDGYGVARQLKSDSKLRSRPLVAVSAFAMVGDREKALDAGFDGYLAKPIEPETFVAQVEAFLPPDLRSSNGSRREPRWALETPSDPIPPPARRATILAVDNSVANLSFLRSTLEPFGYELVVAENVRDALALAAQIRPDLIMSDLHMPAQSGLDFIAAVKADPRLSAIPFVFISSSVRLPSGLKHLAACGSLRFIMRPIEPRALLAEVEACLPNGGHV